ncbi:vacuolar protein sorting-associated protein 55 [Diutina catenulata]
MVNPLNKIIFLSAVLASGFLLILLSCALYNNYHPLWVIAIFLVAPLPNIVANSVANSRDNFLTFNDASAPAPFVEACRTLTGFLVVSGIALPLTFYHTGAIGMGSMVMSMIGGLIVYGDIIVFIWFFSEEEEENDDFNF